MRKIIYAFGIATFLAMFIFTIATSLTNPFYGMSEAALAQTSTTTSTATTIVCPPPGVNQGQCHKSVCGYYIGPSFFIPIYIVKECEYTGSPTSFCVYEAPC